jgi:hypothetical protein
MKSSLLNLSSLVTQKKTWVVRCHSFFCFFHISNCLLHQIFWIAYYSKYRFNLSLLFIIKNMKSSLLNLSSLVTQKKTWVVRCHSTPCIYSHITQSTRVYLDLLPHFKMNVNSNISWPGYSFISSESGLLFSRSSIQTCDHELKIPILLKKKTLHRSILWVSCPLFSSPDPKGHCNFTICFIFSNNGHVGWCTESPDIILKLDTLAMIQTKFGFHWSSTFRKTVNNIKNLISTTRANYHTILK